MGELAAHLRQASISTVERRLRCLRVEVRDRHRSDGRPGAVLRREIRVVVGDWKSWTGQATSTSTWPTMPAHSLPELGQHRHHD
jgi:hypothetical protein